MATERTGADPGAADLFTDYGAPCPVCGGTCYRFTLLADRLTGPGDCTARVQTFCFGCHRADGFWAVAGADLLAADLSRQHRRICGVAEGAAPTYRTARADAADLRRLLRAKGFTGSVRLGRGTAYGWVEISGSQDFGDFTGAERDLLAALGFRPGGNCCVIAPEERAIWIDRLSGREPDPAAVAHAQALWQARLDA